MGFIQRVFPKTQRPTGGINLASVVPSNVRESKESLMDDHQSKQLVSTKLTFDFHRLNVLLLRGVIRDGALCGKKICTATMTDAKIEATVGKKIKITKFLL